MPRCPKHRCCRKDADGIFYKPCGIPMHNLKTETIPLDEFEAMRLCDLDGLDQTEAGTRMGVSRGTIQRLLTAGRKKLLEAILEEEAIQIQNELRD